MTSKTLNAETTPMEASSSSSSSPTAYGSMTCTTKKLNVEALRKTMEEGMILSTTSTYEWRVKQITAVKNMLNDHKQEWIDAVYQDLHKDPTETEIGEIRSVTNEIDYILQNLHQWMKPELVPSPALFAIGFSSVLRKPLGQVLIIGPFNYPILLTLLPLVGSLAGGNPTVIKPSELCPNVSSVLAKLVPHYMEPSVVQVVEGSVPEVTELLSYPWGKVFFTGSERVGTIVAQAAAKTLTPTVLELGGKSPVLIDETAPNDICGIANRIVWGKTFNAGQTCVAPDYVLCHEKHVDALCKELAKAVELQYGKNPRESELGRIVAPAHAKRLVEMIQEVEQSNTTTIVCGGSAHCDADQCYVCPTIVLNPPRDCRLLREEIFGPILPIVIVKTRDEAIQYIRKQQHGSTPLTMYVFTKSNKVYQEIIHAVPSGAACRNDLMVYATSAHLPFGGLGTSGYGNYHGRASFETFTHAFASMYRPCFPGSDFGGIRCHPYNQGWKRALLLEYLTKLPDVPVMHLKTWVVVLGVLLTFSFLPDSGKNVMWQGIGNLFQAMADWTRR